MTGETTEVGRPRASAAGIRGDAENSLAAAPLDLCRLTVLARSSQVDLALPTDVPIALILPGVVELLGTRPSSDALADQHVRPWVLSKVGLPPLDGTVTLEEASVRDGDLLILGTADAPAPAPMFDDLMYAVATADSTQRGVWRPGTARLVGFAVGAVAVVLACVSLSASQLTTDAGESLELGVAAAIAALLFVLAGTIVGRVYRDDATGVFLSGCAVPLVFTSGAVFVPGTFGAPHIVLGASATAAVSVLAFRLGGHGTALFTGIAAASLIAVAASLVLSFTDLPVTAVGAGTAVTALAALAFAPRVSMMQAKLPLPPVPTAGAPLDDAADEDHTSAADLEYRAARARRFLTGSVCAAAAAAVAGALMAGIGSVDEDGIRWPGVALALSTSVVLLLRGRTFADIHHAVPLVGAGSTIVLALLAVGVTSQHPGTIGGFVAALVVAFAALVFGSAVPTREYSPVLRRAAELAEYAAIATVIPLACWVCGLYAAMRAL